MITLKHVLKLQPNLRLVNINNVSSRLLLASEGNCFIAYNKKNGSYEFHSLSSFDENRNSCDAVIPEYMLNNLLIADFKMHNHKKNGEELQSERMYKEKLYNDFEKNRRQMKINGSIKFINRTMGYSDEIN